VVVIAALLNKLGKSNEKNKRKVYGN